MELLILSSLEKVFANERPSAPEINGFSMLKNERSSFQISFRCEKNELLSVTLNGKLAEKAKLYLVKDVPVGKACSDDADDYYLRKSSGFYPDCLIPLNEKINAEAEKWYSVWIEICPNGEIGKNKLEVSLESDIETAKKSIEIEVIDAELPEQKLIFTNWFHADCICNYYGVEPFDDEFWRICRNFIKTAAEHGMNCILTPLFTPPLDTEVGGERKTVQLVKIYRSGGKYRFDFRNLRKWIAMCRECGIKYFEMSHFFTQWGASHAPKVVAFDRKHREKKIFGWSTKTSSREYDDFLRAFGEKLIDVIDSEGIRNNCFFHVSDEPSAKHLEIYKKRAALIEEIFSGFRIIDALSDYDFYETGAVKQPIPSENSIEDFVGKVPELWTYYCCGQGNEYVPNRFMAMPSLRNRVLGTIMYKYNIKGFLHWGYNFYNTQYSIKAIDPFEITDAGGSFQSGDSFVVYPAEDGKAIESLRLKVFYDGFQDMMALNLLESKIGREKAIAFIEDGLEAPISFKEYPHNNEWLLELREKINHTLV